jgi:hypothetical protein
VAQLQAVRLFLAMIPSSNGMVDEAVAKRFADTGGGDALADACFASCSDKSLSADHGVSAPRSSGGGLCTAGGRLQGRLAQTFSGWDGS